MVDPRKQLIPLPKHNEVSEALFDVNDAKRLGDEVFPDLIETQNNVIRQKTLPNLEAMMEAYGIRCQFNQITNEEMLIIPGMFGSEVFFDNNALTNLISLAVLNGINSANTQSYMKAIAAKNQFNPVLDWIRSKPWDGVSRLPDICETVQTRGDFPIGLKNVLMIKWFLSAVAALVVPTFSARGVLVFQGPQSVGKTRLVASYIDEPILQEMAIQLDHLLDPVNKDSVYIAISHWIVELGELESTFARGFQRLKGFITNSRDTLRKPYDRAPSNFPRRTVFIATVNSHHFLPDDSNTRWWTLPVESINYEHGIDVQQFWAEMLHRYESGQNTQWWLTKEEEAWLEEHNDNHRIMSAMEELLSSRLNHNAPKQQWRDLTASNVLKSIGIDNPTNPQCKQAAEYLRSKFGDARKVRGYKVYRVPPAHDRHNPTRMDPMGDYEDF